MIYTLIVIVWIVIVTAFMSSVVVCVSFLGENSNTLHKIGRIWAESILWVSRVNVKIMGLSHIDPNRSYIYMCNHQSNFDIPVLFAYLRVQFRWLAKTELFRIPLFGAAMKRTGYISIDRSNRKSAFESLRRAAETIRGGVSVVIFPEGTRSREGNIQSFKKGGFVLAIDAGVPIVPVVIRGTREIMQKKQLAIKPGNVVLEICPPIDTSTYTRKTKNDLLAHVREIICNTFEKEHP